MESDTLNTIRSPAPGRSSEAAARRLVELERIGHHLLVAIGEDPDREGLRDTPRRWAKWWASFIDYDAGERATTFQSIRADQMVVVSGMRVWSLCEHHLLPFWCDISVGYITGDRVLGLSKFARIANAYAHQLQVQERLTEQIAKEVERVTGSASVAVLASGEHLCMTMRGIKSPAVMQSSVMRGVFLDKPEARAEFFQLVDMGKTKAR